MTPAAEATRPRRAPWAAAAVLVACPVACTSPVAPPAESRDLAAGMAPGDAAHSETSRPTAADAYIARYFEMYPTRATAAGYHALDHRLEHPDPEQRDRWVAFNEARVGHWVAALDEGLPAAERLDVELLLRQARLELHDYRTLRRPLRDPLWWTGIVADSVVFLLVREERPAELRLAAAVARADAIPDLVLEAEAALGSGRDDERAAELCRIAAAQASSSARFFREGFPRSAAAADPLREALQRSGARAAASLDRLATFIEGLAESASGSPRLGADYAERFRLATGEKRDTAEVLREALLALEHKRAETADLGRVIWSDTFPGEVLPADERVLVRRLFDRVAADRAESSDAFVADYRQLIRQSIEFVRQHELIALPQPLDLVIDLSPEYFVGQSVGGVYPPGPFAPHAATLLFLPTPPASFDTAQLDAFFRDFNHHFNVMITPHEFVPGHALQLRLAAQHPHKARALFADGVYVEGWGTFCERLMLDQGWGDALARVAHLKKQLENIARTIVDIRIHTEGMAREEVLRFVEEEALQERQFAANMWARSITSAPQLTYYYLGYRRVSELHRAVRRARGAAFDLRRFMDGMMELGPVPLEHYRERMIESEELPAP